MTFDRLKAITDSFQIEGTPVAFNTYGDGHINNTYTVTFAQADGSSLRYILQEINTVAFQTPVQLVQNMYAITSYLKQKIAASGGDPLRETLTLVPNVNGTYYHWDDQGRFFRICPFIENAHSYQTVTPALFYQSAKAFGRFAQWLDDYDSSNLYDTIVDFHHTERRYQKLLRVAEADSRGRLAECQADMDFVEKRHPFCSIVLDEIAAGNIPLRVCHNDTKLNNVLIDDATGEGLCVIDLDTVMRGSLLYDFGDAIRFGTSSAPEDEENLDLVFCDLEKYEYFVRGYLEEAGSILSPKEFQLLAHSAILMTLECGIRFLTDYLEGDVYFRIHKPTHNLIRARNQFKLVADMESKLEQMMQINESYI